MIAAGAVAVVVGVVVGADRPVDRPADRPGVVLDFDGRRDGDLTSATVTPSAFDDYGLSLNDGLLSVRALPSTTTAGLRTVIWPAGARPVANARTCARWVARRGQIVQLGAALRIRRTSDRLRVITVTQNVYGFPSVVNVHVWDTAKAMPKQTVAQLDFSRYLLRHRFVGSTLCARAVSNRVDVKVWPPNEPEPSWSDAVQARSTTLPPGWRSPGTTGWYVGHLDHGGSAVLEDLRIWEYRSPADASDDQ